MNRINTKNDLRKYLFGFSWVITNALIQFFFKLFEMLYEAAVREL